MKERFEQYSERRPLTEALPIAEEIISKIEKNCKIDNIMYAGSLRRMKEEVGLKRKMS